MKILIVGQGIAGTALAWALRGRQAVVWVADPAPSTRASDVAAGIINPVTGKRFVKSWRVDEFFPAAQRFYREAGHTLGVPVWHEQPILRMLNATGEANDWAARCALPDYAEWLGEGAGSGAWTPLLRPGFHYGLIRRAARADFSRLLPAFREKLRREDRLMEENIDYQDIPDLLARFDRLVFCEGWRARDNPYFPALPWQLAKGEAFLIRFPQLDLKKQFPEIVKKEALVAPLGEEGLCWAGGTYNWTFDDEAPSAGERDILENRLRDMLAEPFEIVEHRAAVRPTVKDRRPLIGWSLRDARVGIFNGMGTKGALLAPFWAAHFADHIVLGAPLDPDVDIRRVRAA